MTVLAILVGMPLAGLGLGLGLSLGHLIASLLLDRFGGFLGSFVGDDPDAIYDADQTNVVHVDFRPSRYPLPLGGDAA